MRNKKKLASAIGLAAIASAAQAENSVTLYGMVDAGVVYVNNVQGGSHLGSVTGPTNGSRFGLRGREDLGDGLSAIFVLENGFDTANGKFLQGGRLFGRQAFVGLQSNEAGTLTLGRQYALTTEIIGSFAATSMWAWLGTHPGDFDNLNATFRLDNSFKYKTPVFGGLQLSATFVPGNPSGSYNRVYAIGALYTRGALRAGLAYNVANDPSTGVLDGSIAPGDPGYVSPSKTPQFGGYASANSWKIFGAAVGYDFGKAKFNLVYTNTRFLDIQPTASTPNRGNAVFNSYEINSQYLLTGALKFGASYSYTKAPHARYQQIDVGPTYAFSKRTDVSGVAIWQKASGRDSRRLPAVASISTLGSSATDSQFAMKVSLRHRF